MEAPRHPGQQSAVDVPAAPEVHTDSDAEPDHPRGPGARSRFGLLGLRAVKQRLRRVDLEELAYRLYRAILRWELRLFLRRNPQLVVVAVTGSMGKTTTKSAVASVLGQRWRVRAHPGNYNSHIGVPLAAFGLEDPGPSTDVGAWARVLKQALRQATARSSVDILVLELGALRPGHIARFSYLKPHIGVVTAIRPVHLTGFGSVENITREKMALAGYSRLALLNADDVRVMAESARLDHLNVRTFGIDKGEYRVVPEQLHWPEGHAASLRMPGGTVAIQSRLVGRHTLPAVAAAAAVGDLLGLTPGEIKAGLESMQPAPGRMHVLRGAADSLLIDDSYNANVDAVVAALDVLYAVPGTSRIAVLGDMGGPPSVIPSTHERVGRHCAGLDHLVTIGGQARELLAPAALAAGLMPERVRSFSNPYEAGRYARQLLGPGAVALIKGSQSGVLAEEATAIMLADPHDRDQLVRQSPWWLGVKRKAFGALVEDRADVPPRAT